MDCTEAREHLQDLNRGRLAPELVEAVLAHAAGCPDCTEALRLDAQLRARMRAEAPRYAAPPALRARIRASLEEARPRPSPRAGWRHWLFAHPWTVGGLAGAVAMLLLAWAGSLWLAADPVTILASRAVAEHSEYAKEAMSRPASDGHAVVQRLRGRLGYALAPVFVGDSQVELVEGKVGELSGRRVASLVYRDQAKRYTTLFLMPEGGVTVPTEDRMSIESFKPHHRTVAGRQLLLWKQGGLACLIVSDLDEAGAASMFLKIRKAS
jgi:anti-sigma factor (TIGR02949 family)